MLTHILYGVFVRCYWSGLYEWGVGKTMNADKWHEFWNGKRPRYYRFQVIDPGKDSSTSISLHSDSWNTWNANIYLHPQGFHTWITGTDYNELHAAVTHLQILCEEAAEACGGKCEFYTYEPDKELVVEELVC